MKPLRLGFAGFRHPHVFDLHERALAHPDVRVAGAWDAHPAESLAGSRGIALTHARFDDLLSDSDAVAIGDVYGRRGALVLRALGAGKHVLADKPLCTTAGELAEIRALLDRTDLKLGMMLDLRDHGNFIGLRRLIRSGRLGEIHTVAFSAQHPLLRATRPAWYFEPGLHGGTLNDIAVHAVDLIPWLAGSEIGGVLAARTWNAKAVDVPHFMDCGQCMFRLENGCGVIGDVSYLAPDRCGYATDLYWRITVHGARGFAETSLARDGVLFADDEHPAPEHLPAPAPAASPGGYLQDFLDETAGRPRPEGLTTADCLEAGAWALRLEALAASTGQEGTA